MSTQRSGRSRFELFRYRPQGGTKAPWCARFRSRAGVDTHLVGPSDGEAVIREGLDQCNILVEGEWLKSAGCFIRDRGQSEIRAMDMAVSLNNLAHRTRSQQLARPRRTNVGARDGVARWIGSRPCCHRLKHFDICPLTPRVPRRLHFDRRLTSAAHFRMTSECAISRVIRNPSASVSGPQLAEIPGGCHRASFDPSSASRTRYSARVRTGTRLAHW